MRATNFSLKSLIPRLIVLAIVDVFAYQIAVALGSHISIILGIGVGLFTLIINIVFLDDRLYPWRWITPAFAGMALLIIYPMGYSLVVAFSNYGTGHILTKEQVIDQHQRTYFAPPGAVSYKWTAFLPNNVGKGTREDLLFWLTDPDGKAFIGSLSEGLRDPAQAEASIGKYGEKDSAGVPQSIEGYNRLNTIQALTFAQKRGESDPGILILDPPGAILVDVQKATREEPRYVYDAKASTMTDKQTGKVYREEAGSFVTGEGELREELPPGFSAIVGLDNILRVVRDENVRDPFWRVFVWTIVFALGSVLFTFALGLGFALVLNTKDLPLRPIWRSILIVPYAVPFWLSVETWRGLLNPIYGPVNMLIKDVTGNSPLWFSDPGLAKIAVLFVNLYLGFPYMMLITLGALQSIPADMYEAALIDGANDRQQFQFITLPMLLIAVGPLLIASFAFNFNNFTLIELLTGGLPAMSVGDVAGHTDILLSYTYRVAFQGARGNDYGFASAVGIFIFIIVGTITFLNFRFTRALEEASENV
jgi:ABC-type sugar transport system permease subunit